MARSLMMMMMMMEMMMMVMMMMMMRMVMSMMILLDIFVVWFTVVAVVVSRGTMRTKVAETSIYHLWVLNGSYEANHIVPRTCIEIEIQKSDMIWLELSWYCLILSTFNARIDAKKEQLGTTYHVWNVRNFRQIKFFIFLYKKWLIDLIPAIKHQLNCLF